MPPRSRRQVDDAEAAEILEGARPRAFWSGTITFGLVSVPVDLYPAVREERSSLRMLDEDGTPLRRQYWCPKEDRPLGSDEIVRGVEVGDGKWVTVTDEELEALEPEKTRDISLQRFVPREDLPPAFFETGYVLTPAGRSTKAYKLLAAAMEESRRAGIATFVLREREHVVAILAEHGILRAETLRFPDEVRSPAEVGLPARPKTIPATTAKAAQKAVTATRGASLPRDLLEDPREAAMRQLVQKKLRQKKDVARTEDAGEEAPEPVDLLSVIRERMGAPQTGKRRVRRRT
ncbi:MAG TPA: Ku protein [Candidatus Polarisedimenticolaceae bacterium]|nr:Ku protein [Candidatus Polarisedimenticolaceae bacterium]